jgi:hypothetical protein
MMNRLCSGTCLTIALSAAAGLAFAAGDEPATSTDNPGSATVVTGSRLAAQCISPIEVYSIDGKEKIVPRLGFEIPAGKHRLQGRAIIDTSHCRTVGRSTNRHAAAPLEAEFEAGKTYYVGYDHSARNARDWKIVIYKVEG